MHRHASVAGEAAGSVGIVANPMSGRDVRRLAARASTTTPEIKRDQVARAVVGAVAAGARRIVVVKEPLRISLSAVEHLRVGAEVEVLDVGARLDASDSERAAGFMRDAGCGALVVLGGDGTNRAVARAWPDAPLVPLSTGTNNVFPISAEATAAGAAAGLVASGRLALEDVSRPCKRVRVEIEGGESDLALIDAALLVDDTLGNYMPFDPARIREVVLSRAEPAAVGTSPIGGLLEPSGRDDEFGVVVHCVAPPGDPHCAHAAHAEPHGLGGDAEPEVHSLLVPISPGLFRAVSVREARRIALGEPVSVEGPGVLAFDGDRSRELEAGRKARLSVVRDGPRVIDVERALTLAAREALFVDREPWSDARDGGLGDLCCS